MIKLNFVVVYFCILITPLSYSREAPPSPVILSMLEGDTILQLERLLKVCDREYADEGLRQLEVEARRPGASRESMEEYKRVKEALSAAEPIDYHKQVPYIVITESRGHFCVGYYPSRKNSVRVFYVNKESYTVMKITAKEEMKAANLGASEFISH